MRRGHLVLNGFMASGKTTIGRLAAAQLELPFWDLDAEIEREAGASATSIFAARGEAGFRALERTKLRELLGTELPSVIAVGGGALLEREARLLAMEAGVLVTLSVSDEERSARARTAPGVRPLLTDDAQTRLLLELRRPAYAEAHRTFDTTGRAPERIAEDVAAFYSREPIGVSAGAASYSVEVGAGSSARAAMEAHGNRIVLVTDTNVGPLHAARMESLLRESGKPVSRVTISAGEEHKSIATLEQIWNHCLENEADRKCWFVGLGGGVVTDLTGFAAATWMRGIPWVGVPTTLLAMVDASVGGKTAIDYHAAKNCIGAFHQPAHVLCDVDLLRTEPDRGFVSALSEVIKTGLIGDPTILDTCESEGAQILARDPVVVTDLVRRCVRVKASVVSRDERESGLRATLNLGHTVGHALEAGAGYGQLTHGEAVSLGLVAAMRIGVLLGHTPAALAERVVGVLGNLGLPTELKREDLSRAAGLLGHDKKRAGASVTFVGARAPGDVGLYPLLLDDLTRIVRAL